MDLDWIKKVKRSVSEIKRVNGTVPGIKKVKRSVPRIQRINGPVPEIK